MDCSYPPPFRWTAVTHLRFDDGLTPEIITSPETNLNFVTFVYRVLLHLKDVHPRMFQLHCSQYYGVRHVNSWVSAALSQHVQHMDLSFSIFGSGVLPRLPFSSRTLMVLKLGTRFLLKVPMSISLDSLKILHLIVKFSDSDSLSRLVSNCPVLEELKLQGIIDNNVNKIMITSVSLKRLILSGMNPLSKSRFYAYRIMLNTPCLQYLEHVDSCVPISYSKEILHCLDKALIDLGRHYRWLPQNSAVDNICEAMTSIVVAISGIKVFYLTKVSCKDFDWISFELPKFPRLINLELEETNWGLLAAFLESSPKLATLSFQYAYRYSCRSINSVPLCISSDLKKIEIKNLRGDHKELDIATYFLEKVRSLNKLLISYSLKITKEKEAEMSKKLMMASRASTSCVVLIT